MDILIEIHDDPSKSERPIRNQIENAFQDTHNITEIKSMSSAEKTYRNEKNEFIKKYNDDEQFIILRERDWRMVWLYLKHKGMAE